ncbi:MAG: ABC-type uncharacterized transport system permease subunit [Cellvibrionaceae bacterium]|jgi:ABC-type uncharacterized transport system permease subunit
MLSLIANIFALVLYSFASTYLYTHLKQNKALNTRNFFGLAVSAILMHCLGIYYATVMTAGLNLGIQNMPSIIFLSINIIVVISSLKKPLHNLLVFLFPLSIVFIIVAIIFRNLEPHLVAVNVAIGSHILLSIISYSLLTMASLQAALWSWQNHQLKNHRLGKIIKILPALQTMEALIFELVLAGVITLALGMAIGFTFIDNIFAQQLVHKTVLSLFGLFIFSVVLWGRYKLGWRGNTAGRWVIGGFCMLMLAYFGSKLVLEIILK